jgi:PAS domain S-box-containing protein
MSIDAAKLLDIISDAVIVADTAGRITYWNAAATRIFGFSAEEAVGRTLELITPERLRHRHNVGFDKSMQTGTTRYGNDLLRVPAIHKEGKPLSIAFTIAMIFDDGGQLSGVAAVIRDETLRFQEERELKRKLAAYESAPKVDGTADTAARRTDVLRELL